MKIIDLTDLTVPFSALENEDNLISAYLLLNYF